MQAERSPHSVIDELAGHPRGDDLARLTHTVCFAMADERRADLSVGLAEAAARIGVTPGDAETRFGNVLRALEKADSEAPPGAATRVLLAALLARGVALSPPDGAPAEERVAESLVWLATHTAVDGLSALDAALGDRAEGLWRSVGSILRRADAGKAPQVGRAGALVAAGALRQSASAAARAEVNVLADEVRDPIVRSMLRASADADAPTSAVASSATGELMPRPFGPVGLVLLAPILVVLRAGRLLGRLALHYRCPAELRVTPRGITVLAKIQVLGRTVRERETHIPIDALQRATREVRYPRLAMYAGVFALAVGSYAGVSLFVDGARAGSPELLGIGALIVAFGVALDFALVNLGGVSGKCRVVIVPRNGPPLAVGGVDPRLADQALARLVGS